MDALPLADLLQALADPTRLRILALLRRMELSVGELAILLDQSQPRVSRHVRILADAGVDRAAQRRKLGLPDHRRRTTEPSRCSRWSTPGPTRQASRLFQSDASKLDRIRTDRAEAASALLHLSRGSLGLRSARSMSPRARSKQAIARALGDQPLGRLVDIGTGTGRMIELFGRERSAVDRHRPLVGNAAAGPSEAGGGGHPVEPSPGRHVCAPARRRQRRHGHHPPGAALCPLAGRGDRRGRARACSRRPPAGRRFRRA